MKEQEFSFSYSSPGKYVIKISAFNLHMDPTYGATGHKLNMTRSIVVQMPVINWRLNITPSWMDTNGGRYTYSIPLSLIGSV